MNVFTLLAYVRTDEWTEHVTLGAFSTVVKAQDAFTSWEGSDGPKTLDPSRGALWDDGYTHYGYDITECELDQSSTENVIADSKELKRVYPPIEDEDDE